jgi:NhaP-type Na+/H+ or K+/H+ antiporter
MIQEIAIILIFGAALGYIGRVIYRSLQAKQSCASGCGKCSEINDKLPAR